MRYWYDCEFIDDSKTIDLISIGIVAGDGRELYLQSTEFDAEKASPWVKENVFTHLVPCPHVTFSVGTPQVDGELYAHREGQCTFSSSSKAITGFSGVKMSGGYLIGTHTDCPWRTREQIKNEILAFMDIEKYGKPEFVGYYSAYDHVAFAQLFGTMMDLPKGFPMYTRDIKQLCDSIGNPRLPEQGKGEHNALLDARWNKVAWEFLQEYAQNWEGVKQVERS